MGILPIGFFSPLPLAMMIPFMATQSLAMGEAFGKSFQYGKRKISAMSNEEFNKLTFHDLMVQQTANIRDIIPNLHEQMVESQRMQQDIFSEMIKIIPTFFEALFNALNPKLIEYPTPLPGLKIPVPNPTPASFATTATEPTLISHATYTPLIPEVTQSYRQSDFRNMTTAILEYKIANELKGSELSLAKHVLQARRDVVIAETAAKEGLQDVPSTPQAVAFTAWQANLIALQKQFLENKARLISLSIAHPRPTASIRSAKASLQRSQINIQAKLRKISQDYRNTNSGIRRQVLELRREIAAGRWK